MTLDLTLILPLGYGLVARSHGSFSMYSNSLILITRVGRVKVIAQLDWLKSTTTSKIESIKCLSGSTFRGDLVHGAPMVQSGEETRSSKLTVNTA